MALKDNKSIGENPKQKIALQGQKKMKENTKNCLETRSVQHPKELNTTKKHPPKNTRKNLKTKNATQTPVARRSTETVHGLPDV
jgi:hypothetical protein